MTPLPSMSALTTPVEGEGKSDAEGDGLREGDGDGDVLGGTEGEALGLAEGGGEIDPNEYFPAP